jgi:hypothetical protein
VSAEAQAGVDAQALRPGGWRVIPGLRGRFAPVRDDGPGVLWVRRRVGAWLVVQSGGGPLRVLSVAQLAGGERPEHQPAQGRLMGLTCTLAVLGATERTPPASPLQARLVLLGALDVALRRAPGGGLVIGATLLCWTDDLRDWLAQHDTRAVVNPAGLTLHHLGAAAAPTVLRDVLALGPGVPPTVVAFGPDENAIFGAAARAGGLLRRLTR